MPALCSPCEGVRWAPSGTRWLLFSGCRTSEPGREGAVGNVDQVRNLCALDWSSRVCDCPMSDDTGRPGGRCAMAGEGRQGPVAEFCAGLRQLQQRSGLERKVVARRVGYSRSQLYEILDGWIRRPPEWDRFVEPLVRVGVALRRRSRSASSAARPVKRSTSAGNCAGTTRGAPTGLGVPPGRSWRSWRVSSLYTATSTSWRRRHSATCLLYTSPSPRDRTRSRMPSSA